MKYPSSFRLRLQYFGGLSSSIPFLGHIVRIERIGYNFSAMPLSLFAEFLRWAKVRNILTVPQLAKRCQAETERYKQTRQSDQTPCYELFRLALSEGDEAAWAAIYEQYHGLVSHWVFSYSRFSDTQEEVSFFVNEAFTRMWRYGSRPNIAPQLNGLDKCLSYLKLCVGSAIEDDLRRRKKDALAAAVPFQDHEVPLLSDGFPTNHEPLLSELSQVLAEIIQDERERLVAEESWTYDLAPRQIRARHPEGFTTVEEINQIKRNLIKRLRRKLKIQMAQKYV
jgi:hypothetical protein